MPLSLDQTIAASDPLAYAYYGCCLCMDGDYAVVGAEGHNGSRGAAYVLKRTAGVWTQTQKIVAFDAAASDYFGAAVALQGDTLAVGSPWDDDVGAKSGAVYVYRRSGEVWGLEQKILAGDAAASDYFGTSVALDANTLAVGAVSEGPTGSAYVFTRTGVLWTQQQKLVSGEASSGEFGWGVALDGDTLAIVDPYDDALANYNGAVYIFDRVGVVWTKTQRLVGSLGATEDYLGYRGGSASCFRLRSGVLVIGAPGPDTTDGCAYVFTRSAGVWSETAILTVTTQLDAVWGQFGAAVDYDGTRILVSDPFLQSTVVGPTLGGIYVFEQSGGVWTQAYGLLGPADTDWPWSFGDSAQLSGLDILVGSRNVDDVGDDEGRAYALSIPAPALPFPIKLPACGLYIDEVRGG